MSDLGIVSPPPYSYPSDRREEILLLGIDVQLHYHTCVTLKSLKAGVAGAAIGIGQAELAPSAR